MKSDNKINVEICKKIIEHMRRFNHSDEEILQELKDQDYQIETILKADKLTQ